MVAAVGAFSLALGFLQSPLLPDALVGLPGWSIAIVVGFVLVLSGVMLAIFSFRHREEEAPITPAHVAFVQKAPKPVAATPPVKRAAPVVAAGPSRPGVRSPEDVALVRLDGEIRELTRAINKAGVMLATGQISEQGYAHYVEELKQQRGVLEADRVRLEMRQKKA